MKSGLIRILGIALAVALVVAAAVTFLGGSSTRTATADFPQTIALYKGSDVRILGIKVGQVTDVEPVGTHVLVTFNWDSKYKVPADAKAVIISPSVVGDRYLQLTPAYTGGPQLPNGAHLALNRTAVPLELDQIFGDISDLSVALGPQGVNQPDSHGVGALTRLLQSTAANFGGQGQAFNTTVQNLGKLTQTLYNNKDQLFDTAGQLEVFIRALKDNDTTVRQFNDSLAAASQVLAGDRQALGASLHNLAVAMTAVRSFVHDNRAALARNVDGLVKVTQIIVKNRKSLNETLGAAPLALNNLALAYDKNKGTLDTRDNIGQIMNQLTANPAAVLCGFASFAPGANKHCNQIAHVLNPKGGGLGGLPGLPRTGALNYSQPSAYSTPRDDRTLAGLVEVRR